MMLMRGFSFVEVLVCLMLISGTSLTLLKQQGQVNRSVRQVQANMEALLLLDNTREQSCGVSMQDLA